MWIRHIAKAINIVQNFLHTIAYLKQTRWVVEHPPPGLRKQRIIVRQSPFNGIACCNYGVVHRNEHQYVKHVVVNIIANKHIATAQRGSIHASTPTISMQSELCIIVTTMTIYILSSVSY